jgi:hypothetical protein
VDQVGTCTDVTCAQPVRGNRCCVERGSVRGTRSPTFIIVNLACHCCVVTTSTLIISTRHL